MHVLRNGICLFCCLYVWHVLVSIMHPSTLAAIDSVCYDMCNPNTQQPATLCLLLYMSDTSSILYFALYFAFFFFFTHLCVCDLIEKKWTERLAIVWNTHTAVPWFALDMDCHVPLSPYALEKAKKTSCCRSRRNEAQTHMRRRRDLAKKIYIFVCRFALF